MVAVPVAVREASERLPEKRAEPWTESLAIGEVEPTPTEPSTIALFERKRLFQRFVEAIPRSRTASFTGKKELPFQRSRFAFASSVTWFAAKITPVSGSLV